MPLAPSRPEPARPHAPSAPTAPKTRALRVSTAALLAAAMLAPLPATAGTVQLTNDDELTGVITQRDEQGVTLQHQDLGTLRLGNAEIKDVTMKESDPAYVVPPEPDFFLGWDKTLSAGINGSRGNTDAVNIYASFDTSYENPEHRWLIDADLFYAEDEGENIRNYFQTSLTKDWLIEDRPEFYWINLKYEQDRFTGWEQRTSGFAGVGYEFIDDRDYTIIGRLGAGGQYEAGQVNEFTPELLIALEGKWTINSDSSLRYYTYFYPSLDPAFSEFRNVSGLAYKISIDHAKGLSLKAGVENQYQSEVAQGTEKNDLKYYAALVLDF